MGTAKNSNSGHGGHPCRLPPASSSCSTTGDGHRLEQPGRIGFLLWGGRPYLVVVGQTLAIAAELRDQLA